MTHKGRISRSVVAPHLATKSVGGFTVVPENYRDDALEYLCEQLMHGVPLADICDQEMMPSKTLVLKWMATDVGFKRDFLEAQRVRALLESENILTIADGNSGKMLYKEELDEDGEVIAQHYVREDVQRSRLRVDTRFKLLAKLEPEVFGDKVELGHTVTGDLLKLLEGATNQGHKLPRAAGG